MSTEPTIVARPTQPYVGILRSTTMNTLADVADRIPEILTWLTNEGIPPAGPPFLRYHVIDMARELQVEAAWPISEALIGGEDPIAPGALPAGRYVSRTHVGDPQQLDGVVREIFDWVDQQGLVLDRSDTPQGERWAGRVEILHTDPRQEPDVNRWRIELQFKLAE